MKPAEIATRLRTLADRLEANADRPFGGFFMIVPPNGESDEGLILEGKPDDAMFFGLVKAKLEMAVAAMESLLRQQGRMR